ncbi:MAG: PrgI family protein [Anaerolineales bacterium]|nr:PrgI family protein [Anaerolineales bacterium]
MDVTQKTFLGLTYRQIGLMAGAGLAAVFTFSQLHLWPIYLRGGVAVLLLGLGLALAFGQIDGLPPERWLIDVILFRRRSRHFLHRAMQGDGSGRRVIYPTAEPNSSTRLEATDEASSGTPQPGFLWLTANMIGVAILTGLALWLWHGGAEDLSRLWQRF